MAEGEQAQQIVRSKFAEEGWYFVPEHEQVGGTHYEEMPIQPWEVIERAELDFWEGSVVKYVMRYTGKSGVEDLKKARHYLDYLIEREEKKDF